MRISNALYTYPVLSNQGLRDDYIESSDFSVVVSQTQTGVSETSLGVSVSLRDDGIQALLNNNQAKIICHIESPLTSYREVVSVDPFDMFVSIPVDTARMRLSLEITVLVVASSSIENYSSQTFSDIYRGSYHIEVGDILAFAPTIEIEIRPDDIDSNPTQSIVRVKPHNQREMLVDTSGDYIVISLPQSTYLNYKRLSYPGSPHYKLSLLAIVLPALIEALYIMKSDNDDHESKIWSKVLMAKLKLGGWGSDPRVYDPVLSAQFLLNNPADEAFEPIVETLYEGGE